MGSETAQRFFEDYIGRPATAFRTLAQSGSARINFLASAGNSNFILTHNENLRENEAFFYFSELFSSLKLNTPEIYKISDDRKLYIQEYLGSKTLSEIITEESLSERVTALVKQVLQKLYRLQQSTWGKVDYSKTFEYDCYNELPITSDLFYFKSFIADVLELPYHKSGLLNEFKAIIKLVENLKPKVLMIRDFQARNIMVNDAGEVSFIDYQSAMLGPAMYDVVSFLYQAKANFPENFRREMLQFYISQYEDRQARTDLENSVAPIQLMRFLQVLGAYGFRGLIQRKPHFMASIDAGINNLSQFAEEWDKMDNFPNLKMLITQLSSEETQRKIKTIIN